MNLFDIIRNIDCTLHGTGNASQCDITTLTFASRKATKDCLYVAQVGVHVDGHKFINTVVKQGASAIVCQELPAKLAQGVIYVQTADTNHALGILAANFYNHPSHKLKLIGITGTNGKTTTVTLLHRMFRLQGYHVGLLSTIVNKIDETEIPADHTTPDAIEINALLSRMVEAGCQYCFMEVSSHAIVQERIGGLTFSGAIFSNITHDHLDFHKTMAAYIAAKKKFFDNLPKEAFALTNIDDKNGMVMVQNTRATVKTYRLREMADFHCKIEESTFQGLLLQIDANTNVTVHGAPYEDIIMADRWGHVRSKVMTQLVGRFNAYNLLAIYGTAVMCGTDPQEALVLLSQLKAAEGRFEYVTGRGITAIVDYAHTPDALDNVLSTINEVRQRGCNLIVVVGCGGDRDPLKRPIMAKIASEHCDRLVLTSDNPRTEDPDAILDEMETGLSLTQKSATVRITDRRQAIKTACMMARDGDIVLVAGKGHEKYQEVNGVRHHFDDREELENLLCTEQGDFLNRDRNHENTI